jgi:hypothetical protein
VHTYDSVSGVFTIILIETITIYPNPVKLLNNLGFIQCYYRHVSGTFIHFFLYIPENRTNKPTKDAIKYVNEKIYLSSSGSRL